MFSLQDDFLSPGEVCIKPVAPQRKVEITLQDCLACSGCVTSAESVLVLAQSTAELETRLEALSAKNEVLVVSVAAEARASLAAHFGLSLAQCQARLETLFRSWGARAVLDVELARRVQMLEMRHEFVRHVRQCRAAGTVTPLLASSCPGWICYAEKSQPQALPHISRVRSAQQIMGQYVKRALGPAMGAPSVYHVCIMMCYDKKLEATRDVFAQDNVRDVDTVLATSELLEYMQKKGIDFASLPETPLEAPLRGETEGSGAQASAMFRAAVREVYGREPPAKVEYKIGRNQDIREASFALDEERPLKVGVANGFRNIQNIVRKLKMGTCDLHFVEIMACPSGCLNGGGQVRADNPKDREQSKQKLAKVQQVYATIEPSDETNDEQELKEFYSLVGGPPGSDAAKKLFYTDYKEVSQMEDAIVVNW